MNMRKNTLQKAVMTQAHQMFRNNPELGWVRILKHSHYLASYARMAIKKDLRDTVVNFEFLKADGSIRIAKGTTDLCHIPSVDHPTSYPRAIKPESGATSYYDLDKMGWRSFSKSSIVYIDESEMDEETI